MPNSIKHLFHVEVHMPAKHIIQVQNLMDHSTVC